MKSDNMMLLGVGVVVLLILFVLVAGLLMITFGGEQPSVENNNIVKYQCTDGKIVSKLSECPKVTTTIASASSVVTRTSASGVTSIGPGASCPKCDCVTRPTTTPPTTMCIPCASASTCGSPSSEVICKEGESGGISYDTWDVTYMPACSSGCCMWTSSRTPKSSCKDNEVCLKGACIVRNETVGE